MRQCHPAECRRLRILMVPCRTNTGPNQYTALMASALEDCGHVVHDVAVSPPPTPGRRLRGPKPILPALARAARCLLHRHDIVHVHWPHAFALDYAYPVAVLRSLLFVLALWMQRALGARIVWTVHDARPVTGRRRRLAGVLASSILPAIDGFVFISPSSRATLEHEYPPARRRPHLLTRHASYGDVYPRTPATAARTSFGVAGDKPVIGFLGDLKEYKGLDGFLDACAGLRNGGPVVLLAGEAIRPVTEAHVARRVAQLQAIGGNIVRTHRRRLSDRELATAVAACDLVVLPYRSGWNSGIATLVLEHDRALLCTDLPVFRDLQAEVGGDWVTLHQYPLTTSVLARAAAWGRRQRLVGARVPPDFVERRRWPAVAAEIVRLYRGLSCLPPST